jgi:hypothetical protein
VLWVQDIHHYWLADLVEAPKQFHHQPRHWV